MDKITLPAKWRDWTIVELIGEGGDGKVYKAEKYDGVVKSVSAIKVMEIAADNERLASLMRRFQTEEAARDFLWNLVQQYAEEIRTMYRVQGETNLVSIQDHLIEEMEDNRGWRMYIRMEYLQSLGDYLTTHEMTQSDIARLGISICGALEKCEKLQILHRDIKPENILVSPSGEFKLGDFGVSRVLDAEKTRYGSEGTWLYMAPEAYKGEPCDKESDIYSLGLVLYALANRGSTPFLNLDKQLLTPDENREAIERRVNGEPLPPPVDATPALSRVILKACAYKPSSRYRSAAELRSALEPLARKRNRLRPLLIALAALLVVGGVTALILLPRMRGQSGPVPANFTLASVTDEWISYQAELDEKHAIELNYRNRITLNGGFEQNAAGLFEYMLEGRADGEDVNVSQKAVRIKQDSETGLQRAYVSLEGADGRRQWAALIYDPVDRGLYGALMRMPVGYDEKKAPDFEKLVSSVSPEDISGLFARAGNAALSDGTEETGEGT